MKIDWISVIVSIILIIIFGILFKFMRETFINDHAMEIEGYLNTFNGRLSVDRQYLNDNIFDDVFYYPNNEETGETGWEKCKLECPGNCVEDFVSGNAYCFPY